MFTVHLMIIPSPTKKNLHLKLTHLFYLKNKILIIIIVTLFILHLSYINYI